MAFDSQLNITQLLKTFRIDMSTSVREFNLLAQKWHEIKHRVTGIEESESGDDE